MDEGEVHQYRLLGDYLKREGHRVLKAAVEATLQNGKESEAASILTLTLSVSVSLGVSTEESECQILEVDEDTVLETMESWSA